MDEPSAETIVTLPPPDMAWTVVHARPRCEKKIAEYLHLQNLRCYLPLRRKTHRYGNRERVFMSPLFSGYLFCVLGAGQRSAVAQNRYVANVLNVLDQTKFVAQLRQVEVALAGGQITEVLPFLVSGHRVRVSHGPLRGIEGVIQRVKGRTRVVINVDMIRQAMAVEVDSAMLEPA
ncbi:MAG: transcription termination/antitermination NusG family protein [bacterium]